MHRLRVRFRRGVELRYISHLDIMRLWVRALRRARVPLAYSEGFTPHARVSLAAPLSVGVTGEGELMDVIATRPVSPHWFTDSLNRHLPHGMEVLEVYPVPPSAPSLQSQVRFAHYLVELATDKTEQEVQLAISHLLSLAQLPWHHERDTGARHYDLRALIEEITLVEWHRGRCVLAMKLRNDERGSGRPEQVALALGFTEHPRAIQRTRLTLGPAPRTGR